MAERRADVFLRWRADIRYRSTAIPVGFARKWAAERAHTHCAGRYGLDWRLLPSTDVAELTCKVTADNNRIVCGSGGAKFRA